MFRAVRAAAPVLVVLMVVGVLIGGSPTGTHAAATTCRGKTATIVGTPAADVLTGTKGPDVIAALGGDDVVEGLGGDDRICGGGGADRLAGGVGADRLHGESDRLSADESGTFLVGDTLLGGPGDDLLDPGHDRRRVDARRSPDTLSWADAGAGVQVDLTTGLATGAGQDTIVLTPALGVEGSPWSDRITGSAGPDWIAGAEGDDEILAGDGDDTIFTERPTLEAGASPDQDVVDAGPGDDFVSTQLGRDRVSTAGGADWIEAYGSSPVVIDAGGGADEVLQSALAEAGAGSAGGAGNDRITYYGTYLEGLEPRAEFTIDLRTGTTTTSLDPAATGTIAGFQEHRLVGDVSWQFHGTAGPNRIWAITGGGLRAWLYDGDDWAIGSELDDFVDAGPGDDHVNGRAGDDVCRRAERGVC